MATSQTASTPAFDTRAVPVTRRRRRRWRPPAVLGLLPLALALLLWQLLGDPRSRSFPPPSTWFAAIAQMWSAGTLAPALLSTLLTFLFGALLALVVGVAVGVIIGLSPVLERALAPLMDFFRTLPPPVIVSVSALILGITFQAGVVIVAFSVVWPILLNTVTAVRTVPPVRLEMARSANLPAAARFTKVLLPSLLPGIAVGFKVALSTALVITLLVDLIASASGIGRLLIINQQMFRADAVWGLLFIIGTVGYLLNVVVVLVEKWLFRHWPPVA